MRPIASQQAPKPAGHYSQGIVHGGLVFVSGQLPLDPESGAVVGDNADAQTERTLRNVEAILVAAGSGLHNLLSVTVYVTGRRHWEEVNRAFVRIMGEHRPARAVIPVAELKPGCLVEIQAVAATDES